MGLKAPNCSNLGAQTRGGEGVTVFRVLVSDTFSTFKSRDDTKLVKEISRAQIQLCKETVFSEELRLLEQNVQRIHPHTFGHVK